MPNSTASDIVVSPLRLWIAPQRTSIGAHDYVQPPTTPWIEINTNSQADLAAAPELNVSIKDFDVMSEGLTVQRGVFNTEMAVSLKFETYDMSMNTWAMVLNGNTVTPTVAASGTPGFEVIDLLVGFTKTKYAIIADCPSPADPDNAALFMRFYFPRMSITTTKPIPFSKGKAASTELTLKNIFDNKASSYKYGKIIILTDPALP